MRQEGRAAPPALMLAALVAVAACSGGPPPRPEPELVVDGVEVGFRGARPLWRELPDDLHQAVAAAEDYWGGPVPPGTTVEFLEAPFTHDTCLGTTWTGYGPPVIQVATTPYRCAGSTALVHELGHAILGGDPGHKDPRWRPSIERYWALAKAASVCGDFTL